MSIRPDDDADQSIIRRLALAGDVTGLGLALLLAIALVGLLF